MRMFFCLFSSYNNGTCTTTLLYNAERMHIVPNSNRSLWLLVMYEALACWWRSSVFGGSIFTTFTCQYQYNTRTQLELELPWWYPAVQFSILDHWSVRCSLQFFLRKENLVLGQSLPFCKVAEVITVAIIARNCFAF